MGNSFYLAWEPRLMEWLQDHIGSFGVKFMSACSAFGEETILIAVMCVLYFIYDKEAAKFVARRFMIAGTGLTCIKNVVCRLRPYMVHESVNCLKPVDASADLLDIKAQGYSFPSGHSEGSACIFGGTAVSLKKKWVTIAAIIIVFFVGVSRFCLGVHYPTDVMCGWAVGIGSVYLFTLMEKFIKDRRIIYAIWLVVLAVGMFYCTTNDYFTNYGMMIGVFAADLFEEKFVKFEKPKNILWGLLRMAGALVIYYGVNILLKLPFKGLVNGTTPERVFRVCRYAVIMFLAMGVYPMVFKFFHKKQ